MAKPRKSRPPRDYRAEEARRNAKAKALGFSSRAQMRRAQRHGYKPTRKGESPRSPIVVKPAAKVTPAKLRLFSARPPKPTTVQGAGRLTPIARIRRENQAWSNAHS